MPAEAAAAWGALSSLTSLEVDAIPYLAPVVQQLPNLVELSVTHFIDFGGRSIMLMIASMPELQVFRLPAIGLCPSCLFTKEELDGLSSMQQLRHVDGMRLDSADLSHPFVSSRCYPSMQIKISATDRAGDMSEWVQRGGGKQMTQLLVCSDERWGMDRPSISQWTGFPALQSLELIHLDLSPGLQQLRGLTQLTHLKMYNCSPAIHSLDQLPPGLCSLSLDNLRWDAALHEQQQHQLSTSSSTPQLPHLTRLVLKGDSAVSSAGRVITALVSLQHLALNCYSLARGFTLGPLSQLTSLSSLTVSYLGRGGKLLEEISVLAELSSLQQLEVTAQSFNPINGLEIAATLGHLTAITLNISNYRNMLFTIESGGMLQVRCITCAQEAAKSRFWLTMTTLSVILSN
jgi:hypothetical protein